MLRQIQKIFLGEIRLAALKKKSSVKMLLVYNAHLYNREYFRPLGKIPEKREKVSKRSTHDWSKLDEVTM